MENLPHRTLEDMNAEYWSSRTELLNSLDERYNLVKNSPEAFTVLLDMMKDQIFDTRFEVEELC